MARKLRVEYEGAIYHVMNRGDGGEADSRRNMNISTDLAIDPPLPGTSLLHSDFIDWKVRRCLMP